MWALKYIFLPIAALIALNMGLNYSGFCKAEMRWLKDEEYIEAAMRRAFSTNEGVPLRTIRVEYEDGKYTHRNVTNLIKYEDYSDFRSKNPDCCEVVTKHWSIMDTDKLMGKAAVVVITSYSVDADHPDIKNVALLPIRNCGQVWRR